MGVHCNLAVGLEIIKNTAIGCTHITNTNQYEVCQ